MAHIVVIGAGIGGLPTAYELRHLLQSSDRVTLISDTPKFTFIPSLPLVALGLTDISQIQIDVKKAVTRRGIEWIMGRVTKIDPVNKRLKIGETTIHYDYAIIATGAELALDAVPGLGPERGNTQSVCNPHHAQIAHQAWQKFLKNPGPLVVGAMPGAGCFGPMYEFALLADFILRQHGLREQVPITLVTPEPYVGHLGISSMANSAELVKNLLAKREIEVVEKAAINHIYPDKINLADHRQLPFSYAMLLPAFRGPAFVRNCPGLGDEKGFLPVLPTYQHPDFESIYAIGVVVQIQPPEKTPIPVGIPKTGQMTEAMGMAVAHNIALNLGAISGMSVTPTLQAICLADFGNTGIAFIASPVLPNPLTGKRQKAIAVQGRWVSWSKSAFEQFFLMKMRCGLSVPWFEKWGLQMLGLSMLEPISLPLSIARD
ncbi:MAG TPA: FAD-dependent oxidoreductase [Kamptonema sp.]|nr:FAD-dependent oxidoreductase [Kamptonema sp.]